MDKARFPGNKQFAFSVFDDTDVATLSSIKPVYELLHALNMPITKSVWPLSYDGDSPYKGSQTLEDEAYADYIRTLRDRGFEIAFHGPCMVSSTREKTLEALNIFKKEVGYYPRTYAPHSENKENMYWGSSRFSHDIFKRLYKYISGENEDSYQGHIPSSPYFWGDICKEHISYVRNFTFQGSNLFRISRSLPYSVDKRQWINRFFFTFDADNVEEFNEALNMRNQRKMERSCGVYILSTHFGKGFVDNGKLNKTTEELLVSLSKRNAWFAPVADILDFLVLNKDKQTISGYELFRMECKWFLHSLYRRRKKKIYKKSEQKYLHSSSHSL